MKKAYDEKLINDLIKRCEDSKKDTFDYYGIEYVKEPSFISTKNLVIDELEKSGVSRRYIDAIKERTESSVEDIDVIIRLLEVLRDFSRRNERTNRTFKKYDVFISHASADKKNCAAKIHKALTNYGLKVFYDEQSIDWGDNLTSTINKGLEECEFAIVILSNNFFNRKWPEKELKRLFERNKTTKRKLILPILFGISAEDMINQYPSLKDISAIQYTDNPEEIARLFVKEYIKRLRD